MYKKMKASSLLCIVLCVLLCVPGCANAAASDFTGKETGLAESEAETVSREAGSRESISTMETTAPGREEAPDPKEKTNRIPTAAMDFKPSEGLAFESNGDGTCTIIGIGTCTDEDIVIPLESPAGETVTLIGEYALYSLEDVNSVTFVNYAYEIGKFAFQYGEFTAVNFIGGSPTINKSAFSSCDDLTSILFCDCNLQADEYAFFSSGKDADVTFSNCTGVIGKCAFQFSDLLSLTICDCELQMEESAFSSCEDLESVVFTDSTLETEKYAFYSCGDSAEIEMTNCSLTFDDATFQYSSLESLTITGAKVDMGESVFSNCEDLAAITIDCDSVILGEYAFYNCEDLKSVTICENAKPETEIKIDDEAFQYCKRLETVHIGNGNIEIGEYVFSYCADNLGIFIAEKYYTADGIREGLE